MDTRSIEIIINQISQSIIDLPTGEKWFQSLDYSDQKKVLTSLRQCVHQSHPMNHEIKYAILESGINTRSTPCVMILKGRVYSQLGKMCSLPAYEHYNVFKLLITLLSICDERRRKQCNGLCTHWWHQDLSIYKVCLFPQTARNPESSESENSTEFKCQPEG